MGAGTARGEKRAMCISGNYVERYRGDDNGYCDHPWGEDNKADIDIEQPPRDPVERAHIFGERLRDAEDCHGNAGCNTTKVGTPYLYPTSRNEIDAEGDRRSIGILHGCKVTTGLDDRPEVGGCGFLPCFAQQIQCLMKERQNTISIHHPYWCDGARKIALGVFLMYGEINGPSSNRQANRRISNEWASPLQAVQKSTSRGPIEGQFTDTPIASTDE